MILSLCMVSIQYKQLYSSKQSIVYYCQGNIRGIARISGRGFGFEVHKCL